MWHQDQENGRLIGHMILKKGHGESGLQESSSFVGVHVVGGKMKEAGKLGAFISRVKQGSIADTVGQLRAGKVLDVVYTISKIVTQLEIQGKN